MIWLLAHPLPRFPLVLDPVTHTKGRLGKRDNLLTGGGEGGGLGVKSYNCKKAQSSINHSILSGIILLYIYLPFCCRLETKIKRRTLNPKWNETFYFEGNSLLLVKMFICLFGFMYNKREDEAYSLHLYEK
jgi:hypothetical protein